MTVRAKFKVQRIERFMTSKAVQREMAEGGRKTEYVPCEAWNVVMSPVFGNGDPDHENTKFWNASPGGEIKLLTVNAEAVRQFDLDGEFYVDFTPAAGG